MNKIELNKIYNEDCLEGMKRIEDKSVDMILCDLPYGTTQNKWDSIIPFESLWKKYERIIKDNGAIVLTADGMFTANLMISNRKIWRYNLIWDRKKGKDVLNANRKPMKSHEDILVFYKKLPTYNKQYWYSTPYKRKRSKNEELINHKSGEHYGNHVLVDSGSEDGRRNPLTVLEFPYSANKKQLHPTQKPVELFEWLIKTYTNEGETILDNCIGSGTTAIACLNTNRNFIGFEMDEEYYNLANERIEKHKIENF